MDQKEDIRNQIIKSLSGARFPIYTLEELIIAFDDEERTTCKSGDVELKAGSAGKILEEADFPFRNPEEAADTIINKAGL